MGAHFLSEAGGEASVADGQVLRFEPLVPQEGCDGLLRGGNKVLLVDGAVIGLLAALTDDLMEMHTGAEKGEQWKETQVFTVVLKHRKIIGSEKEVFQAGAGFHDSSKTLPR